MGLFVLVPLYSAHLIKISYTTPSLRQNTNLKHPKNLTDKNGMQQTCARTSVLCNDKTAERHSYDSCSRNGEGSA
jgi:hypothetical protein